MIARDLSDRRKASARFIPAQFLSLCLLSSFACNSGGDEGDAFATNGFPTTGQMDTFGSTGESGDDGSEAGEVSTTTPGDTGASASDSGNDGAESPSTDDGSDSMNNAENGDAEETGGGDDEGEGRRPYPSCSTGASGTFTGNITIESEADLAQLDGISEITGFLTIRDSTLSRVDELACITTVGRGIILRSNPMLEDLHGLRQLTSVGSEGIEVFNNDALTDVSGFGNTATVNGEIIFDDNALLRNFEGFEKIERLTTLTVTDNESLESFDGFDGLTTISRNLVIRENPNLTSLDAMTGTLTRVVNNFNIIHNENLCINEIGRLGEGLNAPLPRSISYEVGNKDC